MYSEPVVMKHLKANYTSFLVNFDFQTNITMLMGDSGVGKSVCFSLLQELSVGDARILCINYHDANKNYRNMIEAAESKLIVIDNADRLLDGELRKHIALDVKNQYLIIGGNPDMLMATEENFYELAVIERGERKEFRLKRYL